MTDYEHQAEDGESWRAGSDNDGHLALVGADIVQTAPYNLDGSGVTAMVYDTGKPLSTQLDFGG